ncbi:hypothetical protein Ctaglu_16990 [Clostridium tagluense]|uniref:Uncharacterized protein n=1 Tax=Clostridium tagluense TaxID=360422 RepID=A0A401UKK6_9CLOT|nr:hypothetical protein Ctaglu_16990 [Clostridium tagluense]
MDQLTSGINRIAIDTEFNTMGKSQIKKTQVKCLAFLLCSFWGKVKFFKFEYYTVSDK